MACQLTTEELQRAVGVVCKLIGQFPCFHIYEDHVAKRFGTDETEVALKAITHNAALDSALLNLRCFNEFFKPDGRSDDVRAYHFPGLSMGPFLTADEERAIHKRLAHLTINRVDMTGRGWELDDMTLRGLQHAVRLGEFIQSQSFGLTEERRDELLQLQKVLKPLINRILKRHGQPDRR